MLMFITCEASNKTEEICIFWLKPEGGNEIKNYIVQSIILNDDWTYSHIISYIGMAANAYTKNLQLGQAVNVSIRANNSAGEGEGLMGLFATGDLFLYPLHRTTCQFASL